MKIVDSKKTNIFLIFFAFSVKHQNLNMFVSSWKIIILQKKIHVNQKNEEYHFPEKREKMRKQG